MNFNKMKVGKRGATSVAGLFTDLLVALILIAVLSFIAILFITIFAPLVQSAAQDGYDDAISRNATNAAKMWSILATEGMFEILVVAVLVILIVAILVGLIVRATKMFSGK